MVRDTLKNRTICVVLTVGVNEPCEKELDKQEEYKEEYNKFLEGYRIGTR